MDTMASRDGRQALAPGGAGSTSRKSRGQGVPSGGKPAPEPSPGLLRVCSLHTAATRITRVVLDRRPTMQFSEALHIFAM